jgi:hypothetical protein
LDVLGSKSVGEAVLEDGSLFQSPVNRYGEGEQDVVESACRDAVSDQACVSGEESVCDLTGAKMREDADGNETDEFLDEHFEDADIDSALAESKSSVDACDSEQSQDVWSASMFQHSADATEFPDAPPGDSDLDLQFPDMPSDMMDLGEEVLDIASFVGRAGKGEVAIGS